MNSHPISASEYSLSASELKQKLGSALRRAASQPVAICKHGKVVAWLVGSDWGPQGAGERNVAPTKGRSKAAVESASASPPAWGRSKEDSVLRLVAAGDFRPSRWRRAGDAHNLAGAAAMLASLNGLDADRMLALAEQLSPGMSRPEKLNAWLKSGHVRADRLLPMANKVLRHR